MAKLRDVLPREAFDFRDDRFYKYLELKVIKEFEGFTRSWPGSQKHVVSWWVLENGMAVGWNENPSRGWHFPVLSKNAVKNAGIIISKD